MEQGITFTKAVQTNKELKTAMVYIRREPINQINEMRASMISPQPLLQRKAMGAPNEQSMQSNAASSTTGSMLDLNQLLQNIGTRAGQTTNNFFNLFE